MKCWRCGGTLFDRDEDYGRRCVICGTAQATYAWMPPPLLNDGRRHQYVGPRIAVHQFTCLGCGKTDLTRRQSREFCDHICRKKYARRMNDHKHEPSGLAAAGG